MTVQHLLDARADIGRKRRNFASRHIDMNCHVLGGRREPTLGGVPQFLEGMQTFFICRDQQDGNLHRVPEMDFPQIAHVALGRERRAVACLHIVGADAQFQPELVDRAIEHDIVIGHVEMAVIVDPLRLDLHDRGPKRERPGCLACVGLGIFVILIFVRSVP